MVLDGMIEGLFMLFLAVWGESGSSSWEFIMSALSAAARERPDRGRRPREGGIVCGFNLQSRGWESPALLV